MLTHDQIWKAIDRLADAYGFSTSGLAKRAGLDPTTFNRSKRFSNDGKERWPSTESVAKVLAVTKATAAEFIALTSDTPGNGQVPRYIPMINVSDAGTPDAFDKKGLPHSKGNKKWDDVQFPDAATGVLYALELTGSEGTPLYRAGDRVVVAPSEPARRGDRVVLRTQKGEIHFGVLTRQTTNRVDLAPLSGQGEDREWAADDVAAVSRIVWASQ